MAVHELLRCGLIGLQIRAVLHEAEHRLSGQIRAGGVNVAVNKAGGDVLSGKVNDIGSLADEVLDSFGGADIDDLAVLHGDGLRGVVLGHHGLDRTVCKNKVGCVCRGFGGGSFRRSFRGRGLRHAFTAGEQRQRHGQRQQQRKCAIAFFHWGHSFHLIKFPGVVGRCALSDGRKTLPYRPRS